jgi:serine O-acetyltransferase
MSEQATIFDGCGMWACLGRDTNRLARGHAGTLKTLALFVTNRGLQSMFLYRLSRACWKRRIPILPLILTRVTQHLFAVDIDYRADLGPGIVIVHGFGIVIGNGARVEGDCAIFHGVTLGNRGSEWVGSDVPDGQPTVGKNCMLGAGAKLLGPITVGRNCVIGANAVVVRDVPPSSIVAGVPGRVVGTRPEMDENLRPVSRAAAVS